jgi:hypothetical protein
VNKYLRSSDQFVCFGVFASGYKRAQSTRRYKKLVEGASQPDSANTNTGVQVDYHISSHKYFIFVVRSMFSCALDLPVFGSHRLRLPFLLFGKRELAQFVSIYQNPRYT